MASFEKGDRVVAVIARPGVFNVGDTGTVNENNSVCPWVVWDKGHRK